MNSFMKDFASLRWKEIRDLVSSHSDFIDRVEAEIASGMKLALPLRPIANAEIAESDVDAVVLFEDILFVLIISLSFSFFTIDLLFYILFERDETLQYYPLFFLGISIFRVVFLDFSLGVYGIELNRTYSGFSVPYV